MPSSITFFPVGNGDMTLIRLDDQAKTAVLIDCNVRAAADDPDDNTRDVAKDLRKRLNRDSKGRPYVDAFLLSHPDQDHCRGIQNHFYLGAPADYPDDDKLQSEKRIFIREIWSSPIVFRRASKNHPLCEDAKAFNTEAKRRVEVNRKKGFSGVQEGDRILVLGEDEDGKTDDLGPILVKVDQSFSRINWNRNTLFSAVLLAPLPISDDEEDEDALTKNNSSVVLNIELANDASRQTLKKFLTGGDAKVGIWERLWKKHKAVPSRLEYNLLLSPHHCSWHSLSYDSWSEKHGEGEICKDARAALSQIRQSGTIIASSVPIKDDDNDPPCWGAKLEYEQIVGDVDGSFRCTGDSEAPMDIAIAEEAKTTAASKLAGPAILTAGIIGAIAAKALTKEPVKKEGNSRYA